MIGSTVGDYRITEKLGEGGFGVVWKAVELTLDRAVALKTMDAVLAQDAKFRERFFAEAKVQAKLVHPNIVTIHRFLEHEGRYFIVMEFLEGMALREGGRARTLAELIRRGPMPEDRIVEVFMPVLEAVACAHKHGVLHRDIKPLNILFTESGLAKVADFGIAKIVGGETSVSVSGTRVGTSGYMSPEQVLNRPLDRRSDIYALGVTLYEMATGELPFKATSTTSVEEQHLFQPPPPVRDVNPSVSDGLATIITRALAKKPEDRFQSCEEFAAALRHRQAAGGSVVVPSFVGLRLGEASSTAAGAGLAARVDGQEESANLGPGRVLRQDPGAGTAVAAGATVRLVVSLGSGEAESRTRPDDKKPVPRRREKSPRKPAAVWVAVTAIVAIAGIVAVLFLARKPRGADTMEGAWGEVRGLAEEYFAAGTNFDVDKELAMWHFPAEEYYGRKNRSAAQVRAEAEAFAARARKVSVELLDLKPLHWDSPFGRLTVKLIYRYHWRFVDTGRDATGVSDVTMTWQRFGRTWKVVATRETVTSDR